jgi:hypothetical protein
MAMTALAGTLAIHFKCFPPKVVSMICLYATVSPTALELNANVHRYSLMIVGLYIFLVGYTIVVERVALILRLAGIGLITASILVIGASKAPLLYSLGLFIVLELWTRQKIPGADLLSALPRYIQITAYCIVAVVMSFVAQRIVPAEYAVELSRQGGQYTAAQGIPIVGFIIRVVYATLAPFPWLGFDQGEIYGFHPAFFPLHIVSSILATWILWSTISHIFSLTSASSPLRLLILFGLAVLGSLQFSAVGYHAYLTPALIFLSPVLIHPRSRAPLAYPLMFCALMEIIAQIARMSRG